MLLVERDGEFASMLRSFKLGLSAENMSLSLGHHYRVMTHLISSCSAADHPPTHNTNIFSSIRAVSLLKKLYPPEPTAEILVLLPVIFRNVPV